MRKKLIYLFLLVSTFLCAQNKPVAVHVDPDNAKGELKMSDLMESIEYIPLETKDNALIGDIRDFDLSENYIIVYCFKSSKVFLFHRNGRFLSQIGGVGNGPGEYPQNAVSRVVIDEKRNQIILVIARLKRFQIYDLRGKYIKNEPFINSPGWHLTFKDDNFYTATENFNGNFPYAYEIRSRNMDLLSQNIKTVSFDFNGFSSYVGVPKYYVYNNNVHVKEVSLNDTIYEINKQFDFTPKYVVNAGKYEITTKVRGASNNPQAHFKLLEDYVQFSSFYESDKYLYLSYYYKGELNNYAYFDKGNHKLLYFSSQTGIPNDYDGGLSFWPQRQDNDIWIAFYNAYQFTDDLPVQKKMTPKGPKEAIDRFNQLLKKLDPEDNPILMIVKLK